MNLLGQHHHPEIMIPKVQKSWFPDCKTVTFMTSQPKRRQPENSQGKRQ